MFKWIIKGVVILFLTVLTVQAIGYIVLLIVAVNAPVNRVPAQIPPNAVVGNGPAAWKRAEELRQQQSEVHVNPNWKPPPHWDSDLEPHNQWMKDPFFTKHPQ